jgi:hypothetical protein
MSSRQTSAVVGAATRAIDHLFFICSFAPMIRIDEQELAAHIDAALSTTPAHHIAQLAATDTGERVVAIGALTSRLADRLRRSALHVAPHQEDTSSLPLFEPRVRAQ